MERVEIRRIGESAGEDHSFRQQPAEELTQTSFQKGKPGAELALHQSDISNLQFTVPCAPNEIPTFAQNAGFGGQANSCPEKQKANPFLNWLSSIGN